MGDLWIDMSLGAPLVDWYNQWARPDDIARAENMSEIGLLYGTTSSRRLVVFKSASAAENALEQIAGQIDVIGYNLELGPDNPAQEQADPIAGLRRMRALADEYGLALAFGPDHSIALSHGRDAAPLVDIFVLQIQRVQTDSEKVKEFVLPMAATLREANPDIRISVQVRTEGDVSAIVDLLTELEPQLDGVSILTSRETMGTAVELVSALRPEQAIPDLPPSSPQGNPVAANAAGPAAPRPSGLPTLASGLVAGSALTMLALGAVAIAAFTAFLWILLLSHVQRKRGRDGR